MTDSLNEYEYEEEENNEDHDLITIKLRSIDVKLKYSQLCKYSLLVPKKYLICDIEENLSRDIRQI